jgi:hypothetical protein
MYEIGQTGKIRCNTVRNNLRDIFISTSDYCEVSDNIITVSNYIVNVDGNRSIPQGITVFFEARGTDPPGQGTGTYVFDNDITFNSANGAAGLVNGSSSPGDTKSNSFNFNSYHAASGTNHWFWNAPAATQTIPWSSFPVDDQGTFDANVSSNPVVLPDNTISAASKFYASKNTITAGSLVIGATETGRLRARQQITLKAGFKAVSGSQFSANISPCVNSNVVGSSTSQGYRNARVAQYTAGASTPTRETSLGNAIPNPVSSRTKIEYVIGQPGSVKLWISNTMGKRMMTLVDAQSHPAGNFIKDFSSHGLPAGMYLYTLETGRQKTSKRLVVIK